MLVLHAAVADDRVIFWAETDAGVEDGAAGAPRLRAHPFAASAEVLQDALRRLTTAAKGSFDNADLSASLPTSKGRPVASSGLVDDKLDPAAQARLSTWRLPAISASLSAGARIIALCSQDNVLLPGLVAGDDLKYWSRLLSFAAGIVAAERFLPGLRKVADAWHAWWEATIEGEDLDELTELAVSAPDLCRSYDVVGGPAETPLQCAVRFVRAYVDYFVRARLKPLPVKSADSNPHDRWLSALHQPSGRLELDDAGINQLQSDLARWKRAAGITAGAPFRLCFRLDEPQIDEEKLQRATDLQSENMDISTGVWKVSYLLQSNVDPSLILPAESIWSAQPLPTGAGATKSGAREYLLAALGIASSIYAPVDNSLLSATPNAAELDVVEAYRFLHEHSFLLQQAGFKVMLPPWSRKRKLQARAAPGAQSKLKSKGKMSLDTVVDFRWQIAIGDETITRDELEQLAALKVPIVRLRGQWIELTPEQIKQALDFLSKTTGAMTLKDLFMLSIGARDLGGTLLFGGVTGGGWIDELLERLQGEQRFTELAEPDQFAGQLRAYQRRGYSWLDFLSEWGLGACLADDMGLGKTIQTLALLQKRWNEAGIAQHKPTLLICPMSVVGNWEREAARFTPQLPIHIHHGGKRKKGSDFADAARSNAIVITSYGLLFRDRDSFFAVDWDGVIVDEAQNIKNPETKHAKVARLLRAEYKVALTGTPVENHVGDLWSIMEFLNPGLLGNQSQFKQNFLVPIQVERDQETMQRLHKLTGPFILRRLKTDKSIIADLPEKLEMKDYCNLTREQATLYQAVVKDVQERLKNDMDAITKKGIVLATMSKLKQICNHPALFLHDGSIIDGRSGKLMRLISMVDEALQAGDRLLVFTQFAEMGEILQKHLKETFGRETLFLHGGVSKTQRERMVDRFQQEDGPPIFVLSLKAGGVGINLTRANQVIHFDRWWNPAVENQATDRAFRIGQKRNVQVHKYVCTGTLEEKIDQMIESKSELAGAIVGTGESWLTRLDNKQLRELFKLSKEAVAE